MGKTTTWRRVGEHVSARIESEPIDQAEIVRRSGLSDAFVRSMMRGEPRGVPRPANLRRLSSALGWTPDSIERIRDGGEPEVVSPSSSTDVAARFDSVDERLTELRELLDELLGRAADVVVLLEKVAHPRSSGAGGGSPSRDHPSPTNNSNP